MEHAKDNKHFEMPWHGKEQSQDNIPQMEQQGVKNEDKIFFIYNCLYIE